MGLYRCSNESDYYPQQDKKWWEDKEYKKEDKKEDKEEKKEEHCDCDSESARALKKILSLIDELNNHDLMILDEIVERLLCSRSHKKEY